MAIRALGLATCALAMGVAACGRSALITPTAAQPPTCPVDGCRSVRASAPAVELAACGPGDACAGSPEQCTNWALASWSEARDERALNCLAHTLSDACGLGEPRACGFAGRLWGEGRGVPRDVERGVGMLEQACEGGFALACTVGETLLSDETSPRDVEDSDARRARLESQRECLAGEPNACYRIGLLYYFGRDAFPVDRVRAARAYGRGCDLGEASSCNNLGDALFYGDGVDRDIHRAAALFEKSCHLGGALGCANLGTLAERGDGVPRDTTRARALYRDACVTGDVYGCIHGEMLAAAFAGAPRDPARAFSHWQAACESGQNAKACAFLGILYEDGPDGRSRDETKSLDAMSRACTLGDPRACEWVKLRAE